MKWDANTVERVLVKIGLNVAAKLGGEDFIRRAEFDSAVEFVLHGKRSVHCQLLPPDYIDPVVGGHVVALKTVQRDANNYVLSALISLYDNGSIHLCELANFSEPPDAIKPEELIFVDYVRNRITHVTG
jgi:hypothetical protein